MPGEEHYLANGMWSHNTGKSVACLYRMHLAALNNPRMRGLITRKVSRTLGSTTLVTYREHVAAEAIKAGIVKWFGGSQQEAAAYRYSNGSVLVIGGMDEPGKIMGSEYDLAFADECTQLTIDDWEAIRSRMRNGRRATAQMLGACNPDAPWHWIMERSQAGKLELLYSRHQDNPAYVNADGTYTPAGDAYVLGILAGLTGLRRIRLFEGRWSSAEGLVYDGFDPAVHLVDRLPEGSDAWTRWWSVDFGYSNPFTCQFWAEDPDGRLWLYREIYRTKRLVEDHARDILATVRRPHPDVDWSARREPDPDRPYDWEWTEPKPRGVVCDHDAEGRATLEKYLGFSTRPANKAVKAGVEIVQSRFKEQGDGKPRIYLVRGALVEADPLLIEAKKPTCLEQEISGYVWPQGVKPDQREVPVKEDDHGCDAMRYACAERDLGRRPRYRSFTR